ncbi:MAG: hypothetical protein WDZ91_11020 [Paenibacillaceae bacterium]
MNPGYLSYVWMTCFVILLSSGWQIQLIGHVHRWKVMLFVGLWFVLMPFSWQVTSHLTIHFSVVLVIALMIIVSRSTNAGKQFMLLFLVSILISSWHGYMVYAQRWSPAYLIHPVIDIAIGDALLTWGYIKNPLHQMTAVSWGIMVGLLFEQLWSDPTHIRIGQPNAWDQVFIAILLTRVVSLLAQWSWNKLYSR